MIVQQTLLRPNASLQLFSFEGVGNVNEYHTIIHAAAGLTFEDQCRAVLEAIDYISGHTGATPVFARFFMSDAANQEADLRTLVGSRPYALSYIQQTPLDGTKIACWLYLQSGIATPELREGLACVSHGGYTHLWSAGKHTTSGDSLAQGTHLFHNYSRHLVAEGCTLRDNCIRTWLFVNDIDNNYAGVVLARNNVFAAEGLTNDTHFIASTGIGGRTADHNALVQMDAYAVAGISQSQVQYLYAPDHFNRTSDYGVSFERGTAVSYGDRQHVFISGTASIDNGGQIVHLGNIEAQTLRMIDNVEALLREAGASYDHVAQIIVYLRDPSDYAQVAALFGERFPNKPIVIVLAAVCRPGWLIEMECIAVREHSTAFPAF